MTKIGILADTSQDLDFKTAKSFRIELLPYNITMDDKTYRDLVDISRTEFYSMIHGADTLLTAIPSVQSVIDALDRFADMGYTDVIAICSSAKLTGMFGLYGVVKSTYDRLNIHIFDTNTVGSGAGLLSIYAAQLRDEGNGVAEILRKIEKISKDIKVFAIFRTLKYLVKGGRFSKFKGIIGKLLAINPVLAIDNGEVEVLEKVRGKKKSLQVIEKAVRDSLIDGRKYYLGIFQATNQEELELIKESLSDVISGASMYIETELTSVLGVHSGPNAIGVSVVFID